MNTINKVTLLVFISILLVACLRSKNKETALSATEKSTSIRIETDTATEIIIDTLYEGDKSIIKKGKYFLKPPAITPLPFGYTGNSKIFTVINTYYSDLVCKNCNLYNTGSSAPVTKNRKIYKLPYIKAIKYLKTNKDEIDTCLDGKPFGEHIKLNKYNYRLPDVKNYQCYYWCNFEYANDQYTFKEKVNCNWCLLNLFYGYLIFYNPKTSIAEVITIYFDTFQDGTALFRHFLIDKNYNIKLTNFSAASDDDGDDPSHPSKYRETFISISKSGNIIIK